MADMKVVDFTIVFLPAASKCKDGHVLALALLCCFSTALELYLMRYAFTAVFVLSHDVRVDVISSHAPTLGFSVLTLLQPECLPLSCQLTHSPLSCVRVEHMLTADAHT